MNEAQDKQPQNPHDIYNPHWEEVVLLNQLPVRIYKESSTSKTVTLRHDERCAFLRITRRIIQSPGSGVKSLR